MDRPEYDRCDDRLKAAIDEIAEVMLFDVWHAVFEVLDDTDRRYVVSGDDAGRLAQKCVEAIEYELRECLAK
jgi:hypothetical protein